MGNQTKSEAAVAVANEKTTLQTFEINAGLPKLDDAVEYPVDLMADYWTPETPGEAKRLYFDKIAPRLVKDVSSDAMLELECAFFVESKDGELKSISNGSKRLVGAIQSNGIQRGTPLLITFMGKKKNKSNSYMSDNWSIKPLVVNI